MKKSLLTLTIAIASLFAGAAFAQKDVPGEGRAVPAAKVTPAEKEQAKAARKAAGAKVAKADQPGDDKPSTTSTRTNLSDAEKAQAKAKRKAAGVEAEKAPKDKSGPN